jgi:protein-histidine N-methyltransferase
VLLNDGRPNGELLLATGGLQDSSMSDYLLFPASLVAADKYYAMKASLLESFGFGPSERFPVYADRFPLQLLSYLRLSRIQDPGLFAKACMHGSTVRRPTGCRRQRVPGQPA